MGRTTKARAKVPPPPKLTHPDPTTLRVMRENLGRICGCAYAALAALDGTDTAAMVRAIEELPGAHRYDDEDGYGRDHCTVTMLLLASHHPLAGVRATAIETMALHPFGVVTDRLLEMHRFDDDLGVRAAALKALDGIHEARPSCLGCGSDGYDPKAAITLPAPSDPHAAYVHWPVFCSVPCAVEYALAVLQEDFNAGQRHQCISDADWNLGPEEECERCQAADRVGRDEWDDAVE